MKNILKNTVAPVFIIVCLVIIFFALLIFGGITTFNFINSEYSALIATIGITFGWIVILAVDVFIAFFLYAAFTNKQ